MDGMVQKYCKRAKGLVKFGEGDDVTDVDVDFDTIGYREFWKE